MAGGEAGHADRPGDSVAQRAQTGRELRGRRRLVGRELRMLMQVEIKGLSVGEDRLDLCGKRAALGCCGSRNREEGKENLFHARHHSPEGRSSTTGRRAELFTAKVAKDAKEKMVKSLSVLCVLCGGWVYRIAG